MRSLVSGLCPSVVLEWMAAIEVARARTWARGRNISSELPGRSSSGAQAISALAWANRLRCESTAPFGRPVVPEV